MRVAAAQPYPEPPRQHAAWTPPAGVLGAAARRLFDEGFADPRGCDYRAIEIEVAQGFDDALATVATHGWVLPDRHHAIAWNGLVYRVRSVGAPASAAGDARAMLDAADRARAEARREDPGADFTMFPVADEGYYVHFDAIAPGKALLLLRLGEDALAERAWKATGAGANAYALAADDWLWAQYVRGVGAHRRGDVALAIESWRRLPALAAAARAEVRGDGIVAGDQAVPYLADIAGLLADEERRAAHPTPPLDLARLAALPARERIARLIAALDQVAAARWSGQDPIVRALIAEGDAAVGPLIAAYESDARYTRSRVVDIKHGDADRWRHVIAVREVAFDALAGIVDLDFFVPSGGDPATPAARRTRGEELRAYWIKWRGVPPAERYYRILADDALDDGLWLNAAIQLAAPTAAGRPVGEPLRPMSSPSVTALFERRLGGGFGELRSRVQLLQAFAAWDPAAARPFLARTARDGFAGWKPADAMDPYLGEALAGLTTTRIAIGDPSALAEYGAWLATTSPEQAQFEAQAWLAPLVAHRDAPEMVRAANALFGSGARWIPLTSKRAGFYFLELLAGDLVHVAAFRAHALAQLANHDRFGTMKMRHGALDVQSDAYQGGEGCDASDPLLPKDGWTDTLRVADEYANNLSHHPDAPRFRRYWPVAERDRAIAAIAAWLRAQ
ncbi:MAG TPA: hypothetical protein VLX92_04375 [Kofleriaceae bacterium]|nr:hypothetical protein [Kofleriaceae bacterium]